MEEKSNIPKKFLKPYKSQQTEDAVYARWEKSGLFNPDTCVQEGVCAPDAEAFSVILPPPNVTGRLHTGHAAMLAIEDIMVRYNRMRGKKTLWLPGTDHAAIATESKVEGMLYKKERKTRHDLGREDFLKRVEDFAQESHDTIIEQVKKMGASLDWSREAYTLDAKREVSVRTAFKRMYDEGLVYRGERIVNWDPKLQTTVSDDEVEYEEQVDAFYYLKYGPFTIGTARPETKFGDKYVVMHPNDTRYKEYEHGQEIELEWINGPITATIIKDEVIDMEFGSGVMTITPWHDQTDFDIAERHNLEKQPIIDLNGKLLAVAGAFEGQHISKARSVIVEKLQKKGLVEKVEKNYTHRVAKNSRGGGLIEPQILAQWFVDVNKPFTFKARDLSPLGELDGKKMSLKEVMLHVVREGDVEILPARFEKEYFHWIENLRDWNISRQIWFGHRVPVWTRDKETYVGVEAPEGDGWTQDEDTLDTWFSSGLWTFSTLGWPDETPDLKTYHPTNVLETGYDILFFWVARMILMSTYLLGDIPFHTVYLHGLVRDKDGKKMSKSLGNIVDPLDLIAQYGADALRMALVVGVGPGADNNLSDDKVGAYKKFANKLWNITRFVLENTDDCPDEEPTLAETDQEQLTQLNQLVESVTDDMERFRFHLAAEKLYHYVWHTFADVIIEERKDVLNGDDMGARASAQWALRTILQTSLKLLHPFMPFVTETIWEDLPHRDTALLIGAPWPEH